MLPNLAQIMLTQGLKSINNELITVADGKVQRGIINRKRGIGIRTLVNGPWGFQSITDLTKKATREAAKLHLEWQKDQANLLQNVDAVSDRLVVLEAEETTLTRR
jgi:predicted Zn-dependent protease